MSLRGRVVIECDAPGCHAETRVDASALLAFPVEACASEDGWTMTQGTPLRFICPQCNEAGKELP